MKTEIVKGTLWSILHLFVTRGFQLFVQLFLAKLLVPEDFGLVGMAVVFTSVINVLAELGLAASLIRNENKNLADDYYYTAFWSSITFNSLVYLIVAFIVAPFASWFYEEEILNGLIQVMSLGLLFLPFTLIPRVKLTRELNFKKLNLIQIFPVLLSGSTAVLMANYGWGVWSIVANTLLIIILGIPIYWYYVRWFPKFIFSKKILKSIIGFGVYDSLQSTVNALTKNLDYLIIGKFVGASSLGFYTLAFTLTDIFRSQIMSISNKVMFPIYGKIQNDVPQIKYYYLKVIKINVILVSAVMIVIFLFAEPIILLFGREWINAVFPLKLMAIASIVHAIGGTSSAILKGLGKAKLDFRLFLFSSLIVTVPFFVILTYFYGINGTAVAVLLQKVSERIFYQVCLKKIIQVQEAEIFREVYPVFIGIITASVFSLISASFLDYNSIIELGIGVFIVLAMYTGVLVIFNKNELMLLIEKKKYVFK